MASLEQRIAEGIVAHAKANADSTWAALVGGTGSSMRIAYGIEGEFVHVIDSIMVHPLGRTILEDGFGDAASSLWSYELVIKLGRHEDLAEAIASLGQNLPDLFRPDLWGASSLRAAIQTADTETNILGEAIDITPGQPEYEYETGEEEASADVAAATIRMSVAITCDHRQPLLYAAP